MRIREMIGQRRVTLKGKYQRAVYLLEKRPEHLSASKGKPQGGIRCLLVETGFVVEAGQVSICISKISNVGRYRAAP